MIEFKKGGLLSDRCWALRQGVQTANLNKTAIQLLHSMTLMAWLNCWVSSIVRVIMHDETMQTTQHRGPAKLLFMAAPDTAKPPPHGKYMGMWA